MSESSQSGQIRPGTPTPLGATIVGTGTNFAVYSEHASSVSVCLYDDQEDAPTRTIPLTERTNGVWHAWIDHVGEGTPYGFRVDGTYEPEAGHRFNAAKVLVDPYARAIIGEVTWGPDVYGYEFGSPDDERERSDAPNDTSVPKGVVVGDAFDWGNDRSPQTPWSDTVIYEAHVKGLSQLHPDVPEQDRGTYLGAAHPAIVEHLKSIGVTAIEFLPVHTHVDEAFVQSCGLTNYWGYSTLGYFSPHPDYARGSGADAVSEFKEMMKAFHSAGIEVILDVVYNHTTEGNHLGSTLSFRGLDNTTYYHLQPEKPEYYLDFTGTGNSLRTSHPQVVTLVMDSLRYWVADMHVDGFRFDLATTLGRDEYAFNAWCGLFDAIHQDPILANVKLIAEPWDIGEGGYQLGNFPLAWSEWNDQFRDSIRAFWIRGSRDIAEMGYRLTGSSDVFDASGRGPRASVNMITAHDGFTLRDLVSYDSKHNDANGEDNRDGHEHNNSHNHGAEGQTDEPAIQEVRLHQQRNLLAMLMLSQGTPMLLGGDELNRTQNGNNNAYCQDNEISWLDWTPTAESQDLTAFVTQLAHVRASHPVLRRRRFFDGRPSQPEGFDDITWFTPDGERLDAEGWENGSETLCLRLAGDSLDEATESGEIIVGDTFLMILHAGIESVAVTLPAINRDDTIDAWEVVIDTQVSGEIPDVRHHELSTIDVSPRTLLLLRGRTSNDS